MCETLLWPAIGECRVSKCRPVERAGATGVVAFVVAACFCLALAFFLFGAELYATEPSIGRVVAGVVFLAIGVTLVVLAFFAFLGSLVQAARASGSRGDAANPTPLVHSSEHGSDSSDEDAAPTLPAATA